MNYDLAFRAAMSGQGDMSYFMPLLHRFTLDRFTHTPGALVELGVRGGNSTIAFLSALDELRGPSLLHSCDINDCDLRSVITPSMAYYWRFKQSDSVEFATTYDGPPPSLLFVDTLHNYDQVTRELAAWVPRLAPGARILFHDTCTEPRVSEAIADFRRRRPKTRYYNIDACHGLGVLDLPQ